MNNERHLHASCIIGTHIFVAGGKNSRSTTLNTVEKLVDLLFSKLIFFISFAHFVCLFNRYDLHLKKWEKCASMSTGRSAFVLAVARGFIYAIGGKMSNEIPTTSMERYDCKKKNWTDAPSMNVPRSSPGVAVMNEFIFVIGGSTQIKGGETATVERFDGTAWTLVCIISMVYIAKHSHIRFLPQIASISTQRDFVTASVHNNKLIVAGGYGRQSEDINAVEEYDEETNTWHCISTLSKNNAGGILFTVV